MNHKYVTNMLTTVLKYDSFTCQIQFFYVMILSYGSSLFQIFQHTVFDPLFSIHCIRRLYSSDSRIRSKQFVARNCTPWTKGYRAQLQHCARRGHRVDQVTESTRVNFYVISVVNEEQRSTNKALLQHKFDSIHHSSLNWHTCTICSAFSGSHVSQNTASSSNTRSSFNLAFFRITLLSSSALQKLQQPNSATSATKLSNQTQ